MQFWIYLLKQNLKDCDHVFLSNLVDIKKVYVSIFRVTDACAYNNTKNYMTFKKQTNMLFWIKMSLNCYYYY